MSRSNIVSELWDDAPPNSAVTTMQTYIYHLRKLFARNGAEGAIQTTLGGYSLALPRTCLDAHNFERLAAQGRADLESGNTSEAAGQLRAALGLWRGPAFTDMVRGPLLNAEAVRLEEVRLGALEARICADLRLGRHQEVISELTQLVSQQPIHEGFQAKLMTALDGAGRRSEALAVYHRARLALMEELGLEPSEELQRVQRTVLEGGDGSQEQQRPRPADPMAPVSVPRALGRLVGRQKLLEEAELTLRGGGEQPCVMAISGPPGGGKSAFAVHLAQRVRDLYPDGQLHARLQEKSGRPSGIGAILFDLLRTAGFPQETLPCSTAERAALFRGWSSKRRVLVVLDDAVSTSQFEQLLPTGPGSAALVVGRRRLADLTITDMVHLPRLTREDALALLTSCAGKVADEEQRTAMEHLVELCGGLPRALHEVARCLRSRSHWGPERVVRYFRSERESLRLHTSVAQSVSLLDDRERIILDVLAHRPGSPVTPTDVADTLHAPVQEVEEALESLLEFGLLDLPTALDDGSPFHYVMPPVFRTSSPEPLAGLK